MGDIEPVPRIICTGIIICSNMSIEHNDLKESIHVIEEISGLSNYGEYSCE
jgi:hypothetical protein